MYVYVYIYVRVRVCVRICVCLTVRIRVSVFVCVCMRVFILSGHWQLLVKEKKKFLWYNFIYYLFGYSHILYQIMLKKKRKKMNTVTFEYNLTK